jgi:hypothetical protein
MPTVAKAKHAASCQSAAPREIASTEANISATPESMIARSGPRSSAAPSRGPASAVTRIAIDIPSPSWVALAPNSSISGVATIP